MTHSRQNSQSKPPEWGWLVRGMLVPVLSHMMNLMRDLASLIPAAPAAFRSLLTSHSLGGQILLFPSLTATLIDRPHHVGRHRIAGGAPSLHTHVI